jgi:hypothetical protein
MRDVRKMPTTRYATCLCSRVVRKMQLGRCYTQVVGLYSRGRCRGGGGGLLQTVISDVVRGADDEINAVTRYYNARSGVVMNLYRL